MKTSDVLRKARALIDEPGKWCKGALEDSRGAFCANGSINRAESGFAEEMGPNAPHAKALLARAIGKDHALDVVWWNNDEKTTHAEVMAAFDRAIAIALADEGAVQHEAGREVPELPMVRTKMEAAR